MTYSQDISRDRKGLFLFMVDQSRSMNKEFCRDKSGRAVSRAEVVATALNGTLEELVNRCMRDEGVRDYFDVGIIGYGRINRPEFCWQGALAGRRLVPIVEVANHAEIEEVEIETEMRGQVLVERLSVSRWLKPVGVDSTPMRAAFQLAQATIEEWIRANPHSFPPVVINITDGMANDVNSDQELLAAARGLSGLGTSDGNVLLINCHIAGGDEAPVLFPASPSELPRDPYARLLYDMSSELSARHRSVICEVFERDLERTSAIRGLAFNADAMALLKLLDIGTRQAISLSLSSETDADMDDVPADSSDLDGEELRIEFAESFDAP
ncbi:hypothetical protein [Magnetospirillum sp. UT-4]|uniref:hypothetical protein n=1 Tax=Magnetospirillum sp. UT-4 TaxID=2681467 RepID=UPI00137EDA6A|nr:hypothetical protein [Magnetospirillum sp. UT-4]CAA7622388.1 conserved hypothetical protein [Magnetospirillum sp. UT-4]